MRGGCFGPVAPRLTWSVPRCSLRGRSGARHPRHARADGRAARGSGWLRSSLPLRSAPWHPMFRPGRENGCPAEPENCRDRRRPHGTAGCHCEALRDETPAPNFLGSGRLVAIVSGAVQPPRGVINATVQVRLGVAASSGLAHAASFSARALAGSNVVRARNIAQATASNRSATVRNARPCECPRLRSSRYRRLLSSSC